MAFAVMLASYGNQTNGDSQVEPDNSIILTFVEALVPV